MSSKSQCAVLNTDSSNGRTGVVLLIGAFAFLHPYLAKREICQRTGGTFSFVYLLRHQGKTRKFYFGGMVLVRSGSFRPVSCQMRQTIL